MRDVKEQNGTDEKSKERKKIQVLYASIIFPAIIVLIIVFFLVPIDPGAKASSSPKTPQMKKLAVKIGRLETEVQEKKEELFNVLKAYNQKIGEPPPKRKGAGFSDNERQILEDKIIKEKDVSIKSLLKDILDRDNEISGLKDKMKNYEASLPKPHIAKKEETHHQIAMDFLINEKKVEKERALRLVEETILFDPLIPGFRVWNFYSNDEFGTFVTQGNAPVSPSKLRSTPEKSQGDIKKAEEERLTARIIKLRSEKNQLESRIKNLKEEIERELNSLFYMVDLEENLLKKGIIKKGGFLRLGSPKLEVTSSKDYEKKIDLRTEKIIEIHANPFNLKKIKKITLYPDLYKRDEDYKVEIAEDNQKAIVKILDAEKFRRERVVISVE